MLGAGRSDRRPRPIQDAAPVLERGAWWRAALVGAAARPALAEHQVMAPMLAALIWLALWTSGRRRRPGRVGPGALLLAGMPRAGRA